MSSDDVRAPAPPPMPRPPTLAESLGSYSWTIKHRVELTLLASVLWFGATRHFPSFVAILVIGLSTALPVPWKPFVLDIIDGALSILSSFTTYALRVITFVFYWWFACMLSVVALIIIAAHMGAITNH